MFATFGKHCFFPPLKFMQKWYYFQKDSSYQCKMLCKKDSAKLYWQFHFISTLCQGSEPEIWEILHSLDFWPNSASFREA